MIVRIIESLAVVAICVAYVVFKKTLGGRAMFIIPSIIVLAAYVAYTVVREPSLVDRYGLGAAHLRRATTLVGAVCGPVALATLLIAWFLGRVRFDGQVLTLLMVYPVWGIAQQFLFQSFFHTRLIDLKLYPFSTVIVGLLFASVHWPSRAFMIAAFLFGVFTAWVFKAAPNIYPLGVAHGVLGTIVFCFIRGEKPLEKFIGR